MQEVKPVAYTSRSLSEVEQRCAQIEKEMLAILHAGINFHCYIFGCYNVTFKKPLLSAPTRVQRMLLLLQWYDLEVVYNSGKECNYQIHYLMLIRRTSCWDKKSIWSRFPC